MFWTWSFSIRGAEVANQFNFFNDFWIFGIHCSYLFSFKNVRYVNEMSLKSLFLPQSHKNRPTAGCSDLQASLGDALELHQFVHHGAQIRKFLWKKTNFTFGSSSLPFNKILVALQVAFIAAGRFFKGLYGPRTKRARKRCGPYASLFSNVNITFSK